MVPDEAGCLESETVIEFLTGGLSPEARERIGHHIDVCAECRVLLVEANRALLSSFASAPGSQSATASSVHAPVIVGQKIGRYYVLEWLGAGGMGVVYTAYDPELDRKVAIKLLLDDPTGSASAATTRARLLSEAKAMAQVSHPNVVSVFDVGTEGGRVFLAMELVEGSTLAAWLESATRSWSEILAVYVDAAKGLAAAHARGVVHRDFKPTNVLIDHEGRARVSDFGLARRAVDAADEAPTSTTSGTIVGTPSYMAPEQRQSEGTAASDQFSFCVALFESLYGTLPFRKKGDSHYEPAPEAARSKSAPAWVHPVLERGLSLDPAKRYPSMAPLIAALSPSKRASRNPWLMLGAVVVFVAVAGGAYARRTSDVPRVCRGFESQTEKAWSLESKRKVREVMVGSKTAYVVATWPLVERALDDYARQWATARTDACEATRVRGEQSEELLDLRMQCLDARLHEMTAVTELLARPDTDGTHALQAARDLPRIEACADTRALSTPLKPPKDAAAIERIGQARRRLAEVRALMDVGSWEAGLEQAKAVRASTESIGYRPLDAEALSLLGQFQSKLVEPKVAERTLYEALNAAESSHHDEVAARIWVKLVFQVGYRGARYEEGLRIGERARAAIDRLGGNDELDSKLLAGLGIVLMRMRRFEESQSHFERALVLIRRVFGPDNEDVAVALQNLGMVLRVRGNTADALKYLNESVSIFAKSLGPEHPNVSGVLDELGSLHRQEGRFAEAVATHQRGISIMENAFGTDYPDIAYDLTNLGDDLLADKKYGDALSKYQRALPIAEKGLGTGHLQAACALTGMGRAHIALGAPQTARPFLERALTIRMTQEGSPVEVAETQFALAQTLWDTRTDRARARQLATSARGAYAAAGPTSARDLAEVDAWLAAHSK